MGRGSTTSASAYRSFFPTIVTSGLAKLKYNKVRGCCMGWVLACAPGHGGCRGHATPAGPLAGGTCHGTRTVLLPPSPSPPPPFPPFHLQFLCFDACPVHACLSHVPPRMAQLTPDAKLIFMMRDPLSAVLSGELMVRGGVGSGGQKHRGPPRTRGTRWVPRETKRGGCAVSFPLRARAQVRGPDRRGHGKPPPSRPRSCSCGTWACR